MAQEEVNISQMADILEGRVPIPQQQEPVAEVVPPVAPATLPAPVTPPVQQQEPTTPPNTPPTPPAFNLDAELEKISNGSIKSANEIAALIERGNKATDLENRWKVLEDENTSLKAKVELDPFANDYTKRLNELYKAGANDSQIQAFTALNKVADLDGLSPVEAKLLSLQIKNGLSVDEAKIYLSASYKLNPDEFDEDTVKQETIRLKVDAQADKDFLKVHKAEVSKVPENPLEQQQREHQQKTAEHIAKLTPIANNVIKEATSFFKGLSLNGKEGEHNITADFTVSDDSIKKMEETVQNYVQNSGLNIPANEQGVLQIKDFATNILAIQNYKSWIINAASARELQVRAEYNNPTPVNRGQDAPNRGTTTKEEFNKALLEAYQ